MNEEQIRMVRASWAQVNAISEQAAELFYGRLFALDPDLRPLFKGDMQAQGAKLMTMLHSAVTSLDKLDALVPVVQALGRRHVTYGVKDADYDVVGSALLWTLAQGLGEAFTPAVEQAWSAAYTTLSDVMKQAANAT